MEPASATDPILPQESLAPQLDPPISSTTVTPPPMAAHFGNFAAHEANSTSGGSSLLLPSGRSAFSPMLHRVLHRPSPMAHIVRPIPYRVSVAASGETSRGVRATSTGPPQAGGIPIDLAPELETASSPFPCSRRAHSGCDLRQTSPTDIRVPTISYAEASTIPSLGISIPLVSYRDEFHQQRAFQAAVSNFKQPEYTGQRSQPWASWIRYVAGLIDTYRVASVDHVRFLARFVAYELQRSLDLMETQSLEHWLTILNRHAQRLQLTAQDLRRQLNSIGQGEGTVMQFYERLRAIRAQNPEAITEIHLLDQFDRGINPQYRIFLQLVASPDATLEDLLDIALRVEANVSQLSPSALSMPKTMPQVKSMAATSFQSLASTMPSTSPALTTSAATHVEEVCKNCFNLGHLTKECRAYCSNCSGRDHKAPYCPRPCANCHRMGHHSRNCRGPEQNTMIPRRPNQVYGRGKFYGARRRDSRHAGNFPTGANAIPRSNSESADTPSTVPRANVITIQSTSITTVPPLPTITLMVDIQGQTHMVSCQLDTASHINVITEDFLEQLQVPVDRLSLAQAVEIAGCDDLRTQITQAVVFDVRVKGVGEPTTFFVMRGTTPGCPILLGNPWLQDHRVQLYYRRHTNHPQVRVNRREQTEMVAVPIPTSTAASCNTDNVPRTHRIAIRSKHLRHMPANAEVGQTPNVVENPQPVVAESTASIPSLCIVRTASGRTVHQVSLEATLGKRSRSPVLSDVRHTPVQPPVTVTTTSPSDATVAAFGEVVSNNPKYNHLSDRQKKALARDFFEMIRQGTSITMSTTAIQREIDRFDLTVRMNAEKRNLRQVRQKLDSSASAAAAIAPTARNDHETAVMGTEGKTVKEKEMLPPPRHPASHHRHWDRQPATMNVSPTVTQVVSAPTVASSSTVTPPPSYASMADDNKLSREGLQTMSAVPSVLQLQPTAITESGSGVSASSGDMHTKFSELPTPYQTAVVSRPPATVAQEKVDTNQTSGKASQPSSTLTAAVSKKGEEDRKRQRDAELASDFEYDAMEMWTIIADVDRRQGSSTGSQNISIDKKHWQRPIGGHRYTMKELYLLHARTQPGGVPSVYVYCREEWMAQWYTYYMRQYAGDTEYPLPTAPCNKDILGKLYGISHCPLNSSFHFIPSPLTRDNRDNSAVTMRKRSSGAVQKGERVTRVIHKPDYLYLVQRQKIPRRMTKWISVYSKTQLPSNLYCMTMNAWLANRGLTTGNGLLQLTTSGPWDIMVTNMTLRGVRLRKDTCLTQLTDDISVVPGTEDVLMEQSDTSGEISARPRWEKHHADIRVNAVYLHYICRHLEIDKHRFSEAFYMGGDFEQQCWSTHKRLWINPPWKLVAAATVKLLFDCPEQFVFIGPSYMAY